VAARVELATLCDGLTLAGSQVSTKATLSLPLLSWTGERKYNERFTGRDKDRERSLTDYHHRQNRLNLWKLVSFITNQTRVG